MSYQQLQWKGPPVPRAKPIPQATWSVYKDEICDLYQYRGIKLDDVMVMMKVRHKFEPTRRQYVSQFDKWGIQKYNTSKDGGPSHLIPSPSTIGSHSGDSSPDPSVRVRNTNGHGDSSSRGSYAYGTLELEGVDSAREEPEPCVSQPRSAKRPPSVRSNQSASDKPQVPPKKRQKLNEYMMARDPYGDLAIAFDPPPTSYQRSGQDVIPTTAVRPSERRSLGISRAVGNSSQSPTPFAFTPMSHASSTTYNYAERTRSLTFSPSTPQDNSPTGDSNVRALKSFDPSSPKEPPDPDCDDWVNTLRTDSATRQIERHIDSSHPVDEFSTQEIRDMKLAADFLYSLGIDDDAFGLHVILLQRLKECKTNPAWMTTSAMIACARSAYWEYQLEIARNQLNQKLQQPRSGATTIEHFLFQMLLADTYFRSNDRINANFTVEIAMGYELVTEQLLDQLPQDHRSSDILTYHYLVRGLGYLDDLVRQAINSDQPQDNLFLDKGRIQQRMLRRIPGPFELDGDRMKNPCIRSCLRWCLAELDIMTNVLSFWDRLRSPERYSSWAVHISLYCSLWERWQENKYAEVEHDLIWATQSEKLMGIPAAELLVTVSWMIVSTSPCTVDQARNFIERAQRGVEVLKALSDEELGVKFLDTFSFIVSFLVTPSPEKEEFRNIARSLAKESIQKQLNLTIADAQPDTQIPDCSRSIHSRFSLDTAAAYIFPTLAPSLHSSELASLRSIRDRIQANIRTMAAEGLPSNIFEGGSRSNLSLPTMSELSAAMASSLSLSSIQTSAYQHV